MYTNIFVITVPPTQISVNISNAPPYKEGNEYNIFCDIKLVKPTQGISVMFRNHTRILPTEITIEGNSVRARANITLTRYDSGKRDITCEVEWRNMTFREIIATAPFVDCKYKI